MTPSAFITKWKAATLKERSASQEHFLDLCRLLDEPTPAAVDPEGTWYCFERGASKLSGGDGWADVWKRGHFSWEYKGKHKDLQAAYVQLQQYSVALENPPLLIVCDLERFRIHTNWTNTIQRVYDFTLDDLHEPEPRQRLKWVFSDPDRLRPGTTRQMLTEEAAEQFASLAHRLRTRGHAPQTVAHFINRLVFCMFAEDIGLLPNAMFSRLLEHAAQRPEEFVDLAHDLFRAMRAGGRVGFEHVAWFNGGLFDTDEALPLDRQDTDLVLRAARLDWSDIDPSILGTLFERGLDPDKRSQLGAHYTDRDKIMQLIEPVILRPLQAEWDGVKAQIAQQMEGFRQDLQQDRAAATRSRRAYNAAQALHRRFLDRVQQVRVLDPACGSGNFLYLALLALKDMEHKVNLDAEVLGLERPFPQVGPECVQGIEINPYAAELARVTVWIGEIQWMRRNGFPVSRTPILRPLETIACRDAVLNADGTEAEWPEAECIVGNPPFLGDNRMNAVLGEDYTQRLRTLYRGRLPGGANLVAYWFEKSRALIEQGKTCRAGLVATNAIRGGANRTALERIKHSGDIYEAWDDEPWVIEGAAVRVSLICFANKDEAGKLSHRLDGKPVMAIHADLSGSDADTIDLTRARKLSENSGVSFQGSKKIGPFDIPGELARDFLRAPLNPNGKPNREVVCPYFNGIDVTRRQRDTWIIDFGVEASIPEACLYEKPFEYVVQNVKPSRISNRREVRARYWWRHGDPQPAMRRAVSKLSRYIVTPEVSKYRVFIWVDTSILPDSKLMVFARSDDLFFGMLHSRMHELWSLGMCAWHGVGNDPRYSPTATFDTFPFPEGLTPDIPVAAYADDPRAQQIATAARRLDELRTNWLNPSDLVVRVPEVVEGYPDRILPKDAAAAELLKNRTLTNLYNARPAWLENAHRALDEAVAQAYGWQPEMSEEALLAKLLALNVARAEERPEEARP